MEQQIEECNQTVEDAERYCSDKVNTENDVGQEYRTCQKPNCWYFYPCGKIEFSYFDGSCINGI